MLSQLSFNAVLEQINLTWIFSAFRLCCKPLISIMHSNMFTCSRILRHTKEGWLNLWLRKLASTKNSTLSPEACNRYTPAYFSYQRHSWTLNDTLCEVYGWFISLWGSKQCTTQSCSQCGAKEKDFATLSKYYYCRSALPAAGSRVVFN